MEPLGQHGLLHKLSGDVPCQWCEAEARLAALTAAQAWRLCAEGHEQPRLWSVCYVCQLQDAVDTEQAQVAALTAALAQVRQWVDHEPHQVSELRAYLDALDAAGGTMALTQNAGEMRKPPDAAGGA